ncbi:hypothetical protein ON010_g2116 [Phytophthora cinnamomi]|nr:hypothetical protein ON010_g2116 [Phytophthora cinnamomi]
MHVRVVESARAQKISGVDDEEEEDRNIRGYSGENRPPRGGQQMVLGRHGQMSSRQSERSPRASDLVAHALFAQVAVGLDTSRCDEQHATAIHRGVDVGEGHGGHADES